MDFLKTLLVYLTVTMATGVQQGPLPEEVPVPTATPYVEAQQGQQETGLPGLQVDMPETPEPPTPTPNPNPTITPNGKYANVSFGDRGNSVKKLQNRLIELGYLPAGSADGAFGYQTLNAVRAFQEKNGLKRDGIAGAATQTHLYEDEDVVAAVTATPEITNTPEPSEAPATEVPAPETQQPETSEVIAPPEEEAPAAQPASEPAPQVDGNANQEPVEGPVSGMTQVPGATIALGESGAPLSALRLKDGVMQPFYPRVWLGEGGEAMLSLRDMADSISSWILEIDENTFELTAAGYVISFTVDGETVACAVDGEAVTLEPTDVQTDGEDIYVTENFLREVMKAKALWVEDEHTLMLTVPEKEAAAAND